LTVFILSRFKKCPPDKIIAVYNRSDARRPVKCLYNRKVFVRPFFESYALMDITPMMIKLDAEGLRTKRNVRVGLPSWFAVGISTEPGIMETAVECLMGLRHSEVQDLAEEIILGQLRLVVALWTVEKIDLNRERFLDDVSQNIGSGLKKLGLRLINVNITDFTDEAGISERRAHAFAAEAI
jgi:flotillin